MGKKEIPKLYATFGSAGNNTTIPDDEKERIYAGKEGEPGAIRQGEMALDSFYREMGLYPSGKSWNWCGFELAELSFHDRSKLPLIEQRRLQRLGYPLSKNPRNMEQHKLKNKNR